MLFHDDMVLWPACSQTGLLYVINSGYATQRSKNDLNPATILFAKSIPSASLLAKIVMAFIFLI